MSADTSTIRSNGGLQSAISPGQHPKAAVEECLSNIPFFKPAISDAEISAVTQVLRSGWLTTGPNCRNFEQKFAELIHEDVEAVAVSSATAGLHLAAEACGIGPGDQVLVPTLTFTATAAVLRYLGADVILVDIDEKTRTIDLDHAEQLVTPRCKAIMPVHFGGLACEMPAILAFAERHDLKVIDDAAHALCATCHGQIIGSWNTAATVYSFYANKPITTGEGGMLVTRDPQIADRARKMRLHGLDRDSFDRFSKTSASWAYDVVAPGYKYNMTDVAAAIGLQQLARAEELRASRERAAELYLDLLSDLPIDLPATAPPRELHAWHIFPISVWQDAPVTRDELIAVLTSQNIGTSVHYRPLHQMSYWSQCCGGRADEFPVAERYFAGAVTLPLFPYMSEAQVGRVADVIRRSMS